ncbi:MAG: M48 family metalloprotease [Candidatus Paceibacterota bacterium]|jgi:hypothetical protein
MYTPKDIDYEINEINFIPEYARNSLATALSYLPEKIVDFVIKNCVFISLDKGDRGEHIAKNDFRLKKKHNLIIISKKLWFNKDKKMIAFVIAHEVAHAYKKHGFKSFDDTDIALNAKRERTADNQAIKWMSPHFKGSFKKYMYKKWQLSR